MLVNEIRVDVDGDGRSSGYSYIDPATSPINMTSPSVIPSPTPLAGNTPLNFDSNYNSNNNNNTNTEQMHQQSTHQVNQHHNESASAYDIAILKDQVVWIEMNHKDPGMSRVCVASQEIYDLPQLQEDARLNNGEQNADFFSYFTYKTSKILYPIYRLFKKKGIYISDIAEVRVGIDSFGFRMLHLGGVSFDQSNTYVSLIGSERVIYIQVR